jgi:hypothetical protein
MKTDWRYVGRQAVRDGITIFWVTFCVGVVFAATQIILDLADLS